MLKLARAMNAEYGITGMLMYKEGNVLQLLESPEKAVRQSAISRSSPETSANGRWLWAT
jgi:hypothetical protein